MNIFRSFGPIFVASLVWVTHVIAIDPERAMSQYVREQWESGGQLPRGAIYAITQTPDGYLWIGTEQGLVRFDGTQFRLVQAQPEQNRLGVLGLTSDRDGYLWARFQNLSVVRYRGGKVDRPLHQYNQMPPIFAMSRGSNGKMIAALNHEGVFLYSQDEVKEVAHAAKMPRSPVLALAQTGDGNYWLGTRGAGLFKLHEGVTTQILQGLPDPKVNCLLADDHERLWIGTDRGLALWDGSRIVEAGANGLRPFQVLALAKDRDRNLWIGTDSGNVFRQNASGIAALDRGKTEFGVAVTALFEDREGSIWVGSANGLERLRDSAFVTYSLPEGVAAEGSSSVFVDGEDRLWFAPASGGLTWWKDGASGHLSGSGLEHDIVYSISGAPDGLWLGRQRGGITHFAEAEKAFSTRTFTMRDGLAQNSVFAVYQDRERNVWAGTLSGGVTKWDGARFQTYTAARGLASNSVTAILETERGMWFGTPAGLSLLSSGQWRTFRIEEGLPSNNVNCLLQDRSGVLWAGTNAGLAYSNNDRFQYPPNSPPTLRDKTFGIAEDKYGWLWISTATHVLRVNREDMLQSRLRDGSVVEYTLADGLRGVEGVGRRQPSVWADRKGRIWFSLNGGISVVDPSRLRNGSGPGMPMLQSLTADGSEVETSGVVRIPAGRRRLVFSYAGLSLSVPERVHFRYRLDNFDRDWSKPTADRQAEYTNLSPGDYRFRVTASNPDGIWGPAEASIAFFVEPAYWQTWSFRLGVLLLAGGLTGAAYKLRLRRLTSGLSLRFEERLAERTRIAQELHDTLLQGFLSASMQLHVAADRIPEDLPVRASILKTLELINRVTEEGRNAVRGLRATRGASLNLEETLSRIEGEVRPDHAVRFRVTSQGERMPLHPVLRDEVYRIAREAILNAFRHANAQTIGAELHYLASGLRLTVRDDGRGIEPQALRSGKDGHWGLSGMRERADRIGARLRISSTLGKGTEVELTVPGPVAYRSDGKRIAS